MIAITISGGKDSTATLLLALEQYNKDQIVPIFADTGFESKITYDYIDYLQKTLSININVVKAKYDLLALIEKKKIFPSAIRRFCTDELKVKPMNEFIINYPYKIKELWLGIRTEESISRKKKYGHINNFDVIPYNEIFFVNSKKTQEKLKDLLIRMPIIDWTTEQVVKYIKNKGIKLNPLYEKPYKQNRVGCYPCILSSKKDFYSVWKTKEGKQNILNLIDLEKNIRTKYGLETRIKPDLTGEQLLRILESKDAQLNLFDEDTNFEICKICQI